MNLKFNKVYNTPLFQFQYLIITCLQKKIRSDIVYRYMCSDCRVTYYGKTYRHFFTRAAELMGISNLTGKRLECVKQSAVSEIYLNVTVR